MAEKDHSDDPRLDELVALNFKVTERERRAFNQSFQLLKEKNEAR